MLLLSRRIGETVLIGADVKVVVLGVKGSQVRLGFEAPPQVTVDREEVFRKKQRRALLQRDAMSSSQVL
jgi:carbon storage regulator